MADDDYEDEEFGDEDEKEEPQTPQADNGADNYDAEFDDDAELNDETELAVEQPPVDASYAIRAPEQGEEADDDPYDAAEFDAELPEETDNGDQPQGIDDSFEGNTHMHPEEYSGSEFPADEDVAQDVLPASSTNPEDESPGRHSPDALDSGSPPLSTTSTADPAHSGRTSPPPSSSTTLDPAVDASSVDLAGGDPHVAATPAIESRPLRSAVPERPTRGRSSSVPQIELSASSDLRAMLLRRSSTPRVRMQPFVNRLPSVKELVVGKEDEPGTAEQPSPLELDEDDGGALESTAVAEEAANEVARARSRSRAGSLTFVPRLESLREITGTADSPDTHEGDKNSDDEDRDESQTNELDREDEPILPAASVSAEATHEPREHAGTDRRIDDEGEEERHSTAQNELPVMPASTVISSSSTRSQSPISEDLPPTPPRHSQEVGVEYDDLDDAFPDDDDDVAAVPRETRELVAMDVDPEEQSRRETEALLTEAKLLLSDAEEDDNVANMLAYGEDEFSEEEEEEEEEDAEDEREEQADKAVDADAVGGYEAFYDSDEGDADADADAAPAASAEPVAAPEQFPESAPAIVSEPQTPPSQPPPLTPPTEQPQAQPEPERRPSTQGACVSASSNPPPASVSRQSTGARAPTPNNAKPPERRPPPPPRRSPPKQPPPATRARATPSPTPPPSRPSRQPAVQAPRASSSSSSSSRHGRLVGSSSSSSCAPVSPAVTTRAARSPPLAQSPPPRKASVFRQKRRAAPRESSRRTLSPVKCPPQLRIDLPSADKEQRAWLLLNMFRHGDDTRQYEAFIPRLSPGAKAAPASASTASLPSRPSSSAASTAVQRVDDAAPAHIAPEPRESDAISETFERLARRYGQGRRLRPRRDASVDAALRP
ncbi:hypothetical protein P43SY_003400 [Pythium insidiosum]|uniref:Uncharacterized protein n=1 Tax=Pythium insidiosum TaxID=114742 RepID=A0AAD5LZB2_PYTIN|nr:hypothetical protein P43SY_003400 [Pythium insidiosum]